MEKSGEENRNGVGVEEGWKGKETTEALVHSYNYVRLGMDGMAVCISDNAGASKMMMACILVLLSSSSCIINGGRPERPPAI